MTYGIQYVNEVRNEYMYIVLLSGGSGKRLWPLSNDLRSKQYIKLLTQEDDSTAVCSMVQRVMRQLDNSGLSDSTVVCASAGQVEMLHNQLDRVQIAVEPNRRDTFPAVMLACAYLHSHMGATLDDVVCILPVDPYTEQQFFTMLHKLGEVVKTGGAEIALLGAQPTYPSTKYGYIVPGEMREGYQLVERFQEKPDKPTAEAMLNMGALWNCGVFCFRIGNMLERCASYGLKATYEDFYQHYDNLPKISFDYEVLEKAGSLAVIPFVGMWKDLGTWNALTDEMHSATSGFVIQGMGCENTHVINELNIPVVTMGVKNAVVVASLDGILVASKEESSGVKEVLKDVKLQPMYEERRWGTLKTIDISAVDGKATVTRKITIFAGMSSSYHFHKNRDEIWTVIRGRAELILEGTSIMLAAGNAISIHKGQKHAVRAIEEFEYMEIHLGAEVGDEDINRITFEWETIPRSQLL